jgi:hypothetical protein
MSSTKPSYGQIDFDYAARLAGTPPDEDGPIWMINLMSYRTQADYGSSADAPAGTEPISGREADDIYAPVEILADIGAEVVFVGDVDTQFLNTEPRWDRVAIAKYPTRRAFIEMQSRPDFQAKHVHKEAGMAATIVMGCQPASMPDGIDARLVPWTDVPHPPTDSDGPVAVLHVIKYDDESGRGQMTEYQNRAIDSAGPAGVRIGGWFDVEGTIVGDGRSWDQARFNLFPSKAAFMTVVFDPDRLAAQKAHREAAMTDTYTMILRPTINRLPGA